jgi:hypothetical protein
MGGIYPLSDIRANTISDTSGNGPINLTGQSAAKAWASFNQTVNPIDVYSSLNVSSVEDEEPGAALINFSSDFDGTNQSQSVAANAVSANLATINSSNMKARARNANGVLVDTGIVCVQVHGDLA